MSAVKRAEIVAWLEAIHLRQRSYSFRFAASRLKAVGFPKAVGWPSLISKAKALALDDVSIDWDAMLAEVRAVYTSAIWAGTTATFLFEFDQSVPHSVFPTLQALVDSTSPFTVAFPRPVSQSTLATSSFVPAYVAFNSQPNVVRLVASCRRAYREREEILPSTLSTAAQQDLQGYDELYAVKRGFVQAFDRIVFWLSSGRVEVHIDMCELLNAEELTVLAKKYQERINTAVSLLGYSNFLTLPKNLFPKIASFYNTAGGNVISLGHSTGTKSVKEERMRDRALDLRQELFHEHGIQAIQHTDAFAIKKGWAAADGHIPNISIPGHYSIIGSPLPVVSYAVLDSCKYELDFDDLVSKLW
jgi:hypothetical protein